MRTDNKAKNAAQVAYLQARENLVIQGLAEGERQCLRKQRPIGIDSRGRIVIEQKNAATPAAAKHSTTLQRLSRKLVQHGWANGLALKPPGRGRRIAAAAAEIPCGGVSTALPDLHDVAAQRRARQRVQPSKRNPAVEHAGAPRRRPTLRRLAPAHLDVPDHRRGAEQSAALPSRGKLERLPRTHGDCL